MASYSPVLKSFSSCPLYQDFELIEEFPFHQPQVYNQYKTMVDLDTTRQLKFTITGTIEVPKDAELLYDASGEVRGYKISSGEEILLLAALEVNDGEKILYTDTLMAEVGSQITDYDVTSFRRVFE